MKNIEELKLTVSGALKLATAGVDHEVGKGLVQYALGELCVALETYFSAIEKEVEGLQGDVRSAEAAHDQCMIQRDKLKVQVLQLQQSKLSEPDQPWIGESLPPVGTVCEMCGSGAWYVVTMLGAGNKTALIQYDDGQEHAVPITSVKFRPIRTAEQVAAEERKSAVEQICLASMGKSGPPICIAAAECLYDAGYRKQVQP